MNELQKYELQLTLRDRYEYPRKNYIYIEVLVSFLRCKRISLEE